MHEADIITGAQRKFCEGIVRGENATEAYAKVYPESSRGTARSSAAALLAKAEIQAMPDKADLQAGSAVMDALVKRKLLAGLARSRIALLPHESDLFVSIKQVGVKKAGKGGEGDAQGPADANMEYRLPGKLRAILLDNDLAGEGAEVESKDALAERLDRIMSAS